MQFPFDATNRFLWIAGFCQGIGYEFGGNFPDANQNPVAKCYKVYPNQVTREEAMQQCLKDANDLRRGGSAVRGSLVITQSEQENQFVRQKVNEKSENPTECLHKRRTGCRDLS